MAGEPAVDGRRVDPRAAHRNLRVNGLLIAVVIVIVFAVLIVGGYVLHWRWTGLSASVTLWDWLQVLALPIALGAAPVLMRHRQHLRARHRQTLGVITLGFIALVIAGYLVPMGWTGFTGNTLWDWLSLLLLPAVVAMASVWATTWPPSRRQIVITVAAAVALIAVAVPGYLAPWKWTGFSGNTAWDWAKLLLLPLAVPVALLPSVTTFIAEHLNSVASGTSRAPDQPAASPGIEGRRPAPAD